MKRFISFCILIKIGLSVFAQNNIINNREWVDLNLPSGKLWATCNIGADNPEQFGTYYNWTNNPVQEYWDTEWRTPTKEERDELTQNCTYSVEYVNGVRGARYTGTNGKSVFFPFAGYYQGSYGPYKVGEGGQYWTYTPYDEDSGAHWVLAANSPQQDDDNAYYWPLSYFSFPVRPICDSQIKSEWIDLNLPSGKLWATCNIGADSPEQFGTYYNWTDNPVQEYWDTERRTPTKEERDELTQNCTYSVEYVNGVRGARYTGTNGKSIFFPFAGYYQGSYGPYKVGEGGQYWTYTPYDEDSGAHWVLAANSPQQDDDNAYYWPLSYFSFPVRPICDSNNDYVDLGLTSGTLWSKKNIGAKLPEDYGGYYSWGEVEEKESYTTYSYKYEGIDLGNDISATQYDIAYQATNGIFRMPNKEEVEELINECLWEKTSLNNVDGYRVTGNNGNSIFLPFAGGKGYTGDNYIGAVGYYWSSTSIDIDTALRLDLNPYGIYTYEGLKFDGRTIRPVLNIDSSTNSLQSTSHKENIQISISNGKIFINNYGTSSIASVYNGIGMLVTSERIIHGITTIELQEKQLYMIKIRNNTFKIVL